jgi:hypothetical protein
MNRRALILIAALFFLCAVSGRRGMAAEPVSHALFAELLKQHVANGAVDYRGFKKDEAELDKYLGQLERVNTGGLSRDEQLAFYINAYNAWTIKLILSGYPGAKSIKDLGGLLGSPWKKQICRIDGKLMSLDGIEHGIIRPRFQDPRIHFAVNCASKSCPPLASEPYRGETIDAQLDAAARAFINDPARTRLEGDTLHVSMIFKWYGDDFKGGVPAFIQKYADGELKKGLLARGEGVKIAYLDYDWSLNGG